MIEIVIVKKLLTDEETREMEGKILPNGYFNKVYTNDVDVMDENGDYILRFRKNVLNRENIEDAYNAVINQARKTTSQRGMAGGKNSEKINVLTNKRIASNIIGYFDTFTIGQKAYFKKAGMIDKIPKCRQTAFTINYPLKWKKIVPFIKDIDEQYKKLLPKHHKIQYDEAQKTKFVIEDTAFSTVTTNLNLQTACHFDKGDFKQGFGNLVVIERGDYEGGFTGFPQYGVAVDVREGDFLAMNVHLLHGNEPITKKTEDAERLSFVSYLRERIPIKCKGEELLPASYFKEIRKLAKSRVAEI